MLLVSEGIPSFFYFPFSGRCGRLSVRVSAGAPCPLAVVKRWALFGSRDCRWVNVPVDEAIETLCETRRQAKVLREMYYIPNPPLTSPLTSPLLAHVWTARMLSGPSMEKCMRARAREKQTAREREWERDRERKPTSFIVISDRVS